MRVGYAGEGARTPRQLVMCDVVLRNGFNKMGGHHIVWRPPGVCEIDGFRGSVGLRRCVCLPFARLRKCLWLLWLLPCLISGLGGLLHQGLLHLVGLLRRGARWLFGACHGHDCGKGKGAGARDESCRLHDATSIWITGIVIRHWMRPDLRGCILAASMPLCRAGPSRLSRWM